MPSLSLYNTCRKSTKHAKAFHLFVAKCLQKKPDKRHTALQLKQTDFIKYVLLFWEPVGNSCGNRFNILF